MVILWQRGVVRNEWNGMGLLYFIGTGSCFYFVLFLFLFYSSFSIVVVCVYELSCGEFFSLRLI